MVCQIYMPHREVLAGEIFLRKHVQGWDRIHPQHHAPQPILCMRVNEMHSCQPLNFKVKMQVMTCKRENILQVIARDKFWGLLFQFNITKNV